MRERRVVLLDRRGICTSRAACGRTHSGGERCKRCLYYWRHHDERMYKHGPSRAGRCSLICCPVGPASHAAMPDPTLAQWKPRACAFICAHTQVWPVGTELESKKIKERCWNGSSYWANLSPTSSPEYDQASTKSCCQHDVRTQARSSRNGDPGLGG